MWIRISTPLHRLSGIQDLYCSRP